MWETRPRRGKIPGGTAKLFPALRAHAAQWSGEEARMR